MKKVILAALMLVTVSTFAMPTRNSEKHAVSVSGGGKHIDASQVPEPVMTTFNAMYPTATNVSWEKERNNGTVIYQAKFSRDGKCFKSTFAADGTFLGQKRIPCN